MRKNWIVIVVGCLVLFSILLIVRFVLGGSEDIWVCRNETWIKHGHPSQSMPTSGCGKITPSQLANPASVYCSDQGGESVIQTAADGSQSGMCKFPDGRICDEWEFFRTKKCLKTP
jgi:putative hemolysin